MAFAIGFREPITDHFKAPASKPESQRALLSATLAEGRSTIHGFLGSNETKTMVAACRSLGAVVEQNGDILSVDGVGRAAFDAVDFKGPSPTTGSARAGTYIWASGSALVGRVFTAIGSALPGPVIVDGNSNLRSRPLAPLVQLLEEKGVRFDYPDRHQAWPCIALSSNLPGGSYQLATSTSSQFATALLIAAPLAERETRLELMGETYSLSYIMQTVDMMRRFGVPVETSSDAHAILVPEGSFYQPREVRLTGDYTSASYLVGAAFTTRGRVTIDNLDPENLQGERAILEIVQKLGAKTSWQENGTLLVDCTDLPERIDAAVDLKNCPNILPTVAAIAATIGGRVRITGARLTQFHKSRRIEAMAKELGQAGVGISLLDGEGGLIDGLEVRGRRVHPGGVTFADHGDHRIVMALSLFAMACRQPCRFDGNTDTADSFPAFRGILNLEGNQDRAAISADQLERTVA